MTTYAGVRFPSDGFEDETETCGYRVKLVNNIGVETDICGEEGGVPKCKRKSVHRVWYMAEHTHLPVFTCGKRRGITFDEVIEKDRKFTARVLNAEYIYIECIASFREYIEKKMYGKDYEWLVAVPHATIPLSQWVIDESNNLLELVYSDKSRYISLPLGNRSVDEIVVYLNDRLLHGYTAAYDEAINRIVFGSELLGESLAIGEMSTCGRLLGVEAGDAAVDGVLIPPRGVDLAGTSSIFIRSNLSTRNRDPVSKATSDILAKVHGSQNFNEIEYNSSSLKFPIAYRNVSLIIIYLTDDFQRHMDFHGADFSLTL
eukprot:jgi/Tetstr1/428644/TSEL_018632.t1